MTLQDCEALDRALDSADPTGAALRARFAPGSPDTLYFDANSIGPMPADVPERMRRLLDEGWRAARRRSWNESDWLDQPRSLGKKLAQVLGAQAGDLIVCDTTSINQFKLLRYSLQLSGRSVIVVQRDVFPSNRYVAEGIVHAGLQHGLQHGLQGGSPQLRFIDSADDLQSALAPGDVAVVSLSHVDYRSSERLNMLALNQMIHAHGALSLWDLSHSAGAVAVNLRTSDADFALGCGYKYLSGGPGAPSFIYVHPRHQDAGWPALCGWMGHADTFAFQRDFKPAAGVSRFLVGTPSVLANTAMAAAVDIWQRADPIRLDERHRSLSDRLIAMVQNGILAEHLELASPQAHAQRGGHVAFRFPAADALAQALVAAGVVVSSRKPDALRFGIHPLVTRHVDLWQAVERLRDIIARQTWRDPRFAGAQV